jgi:hypothetical protein
MVVLPMPVFITMNESEMVLAVLFSHAFGASLAFLSIAVSMNG